MSAPPLPPVFEGHFIPPPPAPAAKGEEGGGSGNKRRRLPSFKLREMKEEELEMAALYAPQPAKRSKPAGGGGAGRLHPKPKRKARGFHPYTSSFRGAI